MDDETLEKSPNAHRFQSSDGTFYVWKPRQESAISLQQDEIDQLRTDILGMTDSTIQNHKSGNGIPMGVKIPLTKDRLNEFLQLVLDIIKFKDKLSVTITTHAAERLEEDQLNGTGHRDFRGWLSEDQIHHCVCTINQVDGARLTVDKFTLTDPEIKFHSPIALEVVGQKPDGSQGTLALAFIDSTKITIITLLS